MSNRSAHLRARSAATARPKISARERLRTFDLYMQTGSSRIVGRVVGISAAAVRDRLFAIGVPLKPQGGRYVDIEPLRYSAPMLALRRALVGDVRREDALNRQT